jgi:NADH-quinone oxidoreductase subunit L
MPHDPIITFSLATLLLPLLGFTILIFFGKRLPRQGDWLETGVISLALVTSFVVLIRKLSAYPHDTFELNFLWADFQNVPGIGPLKIALGISVDNLTAVMMAVVAIVSSAVHYFSIGYMHGDVRYGRYFAFLGFFSFSMLLIALANNLLLLYVGWELVGINSYLLIGHWYEKKSASDAAIKAFVVNRIGDVGFFIGIAVLFTTFHTFGLREIYDGIANGTFPLGSEGWLTAAGILIFCGAVGKSAQFPLHVWLPDAMEGPTPVSALIHAATMVAAGVYLVARTYPLMTADALLVIAYVGAVTAFLSATIAVVQTDIKKVLAYSTISQLGYMVMALGVGAYTAGFFHLVTHAMFKAGLFLGSGSVIHAMHHALHHQNDHHTDAQDIRNMGGLKDRMPITFWTFVAYTLAISGVPLTSGFLSKDEILAGALAFSTLTGHAIIPVVGFLVAALTAFYMFRLVILTFLGEHKDPGRVDHIHESPKVMTIPLVVLALLCVFVVFSINPFGASSGWIAQAIERPSTVVPAALAAASPEVFESALHHVHLQAMGLSLLMAGLGILLAFATYRWKRIDADRVAQRLRPIHQFLMNKWGFDDLYNNVVVGGTHLLTRLLRWFDDTIIDGAVNVSGEATKVTSFASGRFDNRVVDGLVNTTAYVSGVGGLLLRKLQTGKVQTYIVFAVMSVMVFYFVFRLL